TGFVREQADFLRRARRTHLGEAVHAAPSHFNDIAVPQPVDVAEVEPACFERFLRPHDDTPGAGIEMYHVERFAHRDTDAAALADGEMQYAVVPAQHAAVEMHDLAAERRIRAQLVDDVGILALRYEADVLAVGFFGDDQAHFGRMRADLGL